MAGERQTRGKPTPESPAFAAVLDSCVYIDIVSVHDLVRAPDEKREMRVERLRDAARLAICFHENAFTTFSLREGADILYDKVPAESGGIEEQHLKAFAMFVYPNVLPRWHAVHPNDVNPRANAADRYLSDFALEHKIPLITHDAKLARRAVARGAEVVSPRKYWQPRIDEDEAVQRFLRTFRARAPVFARAKSQPTAWVRALDMLYEQYRFLLLGR